MNDLKSTFVSGSQPSQLLSKMARPDIYRINAFRILELPVTASPSEISSQLRKLDLMEKFGDSGSRQLGILLVSPRPDSQTRRQAAQRLNDPESRLIDELFWFWPLRSGKSDDTDEPLYAMRSNKSSQAVSIWTNHELQSSEANVSMHNLAVLYHTLALDLECASEYHSLSKEQIQQKQDYWKAALSRWHFLLGYDGFWRRLSNRIRHLDDPRLPPNLTISIRKGLPFVLLSINARLALQYAQSGNKNESNFHICHMHATGFDEVVVDEALHQSVASLRDRLNAICGNAKDEINISPEQGCQIAHELLTQTSELLNTLDVLFPEDDTIRKAAHDQIARQILSISIAFANKTDELESSLGLLMESERIAASPSLRLRIKENIDTFQINLEHTRCWFCQQRAVDAKAIVSVGVHRDVTHEEVSGGTQVRWRHASVSVPRCSYCKSAHARYTTFKILGLVLGPLVGIAGCINTTSQANMAIGLITMAMAIASGVGISIGIARLSTKGVKPESAKLQFFAVTKALADGWKLGESPPNVR